MNTISSISSATNLYQTSTQNGASSVFQDLKSLGTALQSGDLSGAQSALATFQQDLQGTSQGNSSTSTSQPFGTNNKANADFQTLSNALQSGNLSTAQQAFSSLQADLKSGHKGHHHHASSATSGPSSTESTSTDTSSNGSSGNYLNVTV
ncbi:MAG: hypothetical protein LV479_01445 [Methylacidiphilales bacterium]|nr:hypothetical protein [Candidatus Methylacidiphilales bacterium]